MAWDWLPSPDQAIMNTSVSCLHVPSSRPATGIAGLLVAMLVLVGCTPMESGSGASTSAASAPASPAQATQFNSVHFSAPLSVAVDPLLDPTPTEDSPGFLTWSAKDDDNNRVRFMVPAEYYPGGKSLAAPPPADYTAYLEGLASAGVTYSDTKSVSVGGTTVPVMTATTSRAMDGALGCPTIGADQSEGCYGFQPEYALRIAVINLGSIKGVLVWARTDSAQPNQAFLQQFDRMLETVRTR